MKFKDIANHGALIEFNQLMWTLKNNLHPNYSFVGLNYKGEEISSIKFYYVFFNNFSEPFVISELKEIYEQHIKDVSEKHLTKPLLPGAGITITIKFDAQMNITKGVFFRVNLENQIFKNNVIKSFSKYNFTDDDFEDGYGQYLLIKNGKITTNEYVYLKNMQKIEAFGEKTGIHFLEAKAVEISSSASKDCCDSKFIALGGSNLIHKRFRNMIPKKITNVFNSDELQYCCPAIHPCEEMYSVYVFGKNILHQDSTNPIDYFIKKMTL
jgi:hypothetical protein